MASKTLKSSVTDLPVFSRFAVLETDSSDEEKPSVEGKDEEARKTSRNAKKRAKKKKSALKNAETEELRNMAFKARPVVKKNQVIESCQSLYTDEKPYNTGSKEQEDPMSWDIWRERDEKYVTDQFQQDLERALHQSIEDAKDHQKKIEKLIRMEQVARGSPKKEHAVKMSLDEFHVLPANFDTSQKPYTGPCEMVWPEVHDNFQDSENCISIKHITPEEDLYNSNKKSKKKKKKKRTTSESNDNGYLKECLHEEALEENAMEETREVPSLDPASIAQWRYEVEKRDNVITKLKEDLELVKTELSQVKKRNKQLCFILGQGEMKDKSDLFQQIEELIIVKDELSTQVSEMHSALEQERSKVSSLRQDLAKQQGARAKRHSASES